MQLAIPSFRCQLCTGQAKQNVRGTFTASRSSASLPRLLANKRCGPYNRVRVVLTSAE